MIEASVREKAKEDHKDEINEAGLEGGKEKDGAEDGAIDHELVEAKNGNTRNIFDVVVSASENYKQVVGLPSFQDLFNASDQIIDEKLQAYQSSMKHNTKDKKKLVSDCARKMRAAELQSETDSIIKIDAYKKVEKHKYRDI